MNVVWELQIPHKEDDRKLRFFTIASNTEAEYVIWKSIYYESCNKMDKLGIDLKEYENFDKCEAKIYCMPEELFKEFGDKLIQIEGDEPRLTREDINRAANTLAAYAVPGDYIVYRRPDINRTADDPNQYAITHDGYYVATPEAHRNMRTEGTAYERLRAEYSELRRISEIDERYITRADTAAQSILWDEAIGLVSSTTMSTVGAPVTPQEEWLDSYPTLNSEEHLTLDNSGLNNSNIPLLDDSSPMSTLRIHEDE